MLGYNHWPSWAQNLAAGFCLTAIITFFWFVWVQPALRTLSHWSVGGKKLLAASVAGMVLVILVWTWLIGHR